MLVVSSLRLVLSSRLGFLVAIPNSYGLFILDHYDQSAVMEDGSHLTDIATHVARPLEYLMSYPLGVCSFLLLDIDYVTDYIFLKVTPVALLIGISEHGIPEPGVSGTLFPLVPLHTLFFHLRLLLGDIVDDLILICDSLFSRDR